MSQQSLRQASIRAVTGTTYTYEGDWQALFDNDGIALGQFNERLLRWINARLGTSYTEINGAMAAMALAEGADSFQAIGTFNAASASASPATLWWNGDIYDLTPDLLIDYDDPLENDVITIERCADGNGFVTVTTWTYTVKEADLLLSVLSLDLGTWSATNYDVRAKVMRADAVTLAADWSDTLDVDLTSSSGIAALYLMMEAA